MIFSTLGSGMNFNYLSTEGYAAFVLAIIFSIISIASLIYFLRHQNSNKIITVLATMVFPVIAVFCWVYLIMNVFSYPIDISLYVSIGSAIGYLLLALAIAFIVIAIIKAKKKRAEKKANMVEEAEVKEEVEEVKEPLLLTSSETAEETAETEETVEAESTEPVEQGVVFSNVEKKTFAEELENLDEDRKQYFNEILEYAMSMPNTKRTDSKFHTTVKFGRFKLLDAKFAKENLVCNFMAGSSELKNYSQAEKTVKIKEKPVVLEINSAEAVTVAKNMIDIAYKNITDAHEEKIEAKKAQRRKKKNPETEETTEEVKETVETVEEVVPETVEVEETPVEEKPKKRRGRRKKSEIEAEANATEENTESQTVESADTNEENE